MKHTPGLWEVVELDEDWIGVKSKSGLICEVGQLLPDAEQNNAQVMADAQALATVPELLKVCKQACKYVDDPQIVGAKFFIKTHKELQQAIAKTEGE